jgi:hypothetical protein
MKPLLLCGLLLALATDASAHRLDEYLQTTRISVATNRIDLSIDLTPGVAVADKVLAAIDTDRDGQLSGKETAAYAERALNDLNLRLDERILTLTVVESSFPTIPKMQAGVGVIRLKASAPVERLSAGNHDLSLTNAHLPAISVCLVNALVPKDLTIKITKQTRDEFQKNYRLEFRITPTRQ